MGDEKTVRRRNGFRLLLVRVAKKGRTTFSNIPIGILLFNKIMDENDEGDFSDRRKIMYRF